MRSLVAILVFTAACGAKPALTTPTGEAIPFDKLDHDQRIEFMKQKVVPQMKPIFQMHDSKKFAEFGCTTCHGEQAKDGHFDMPNAKLPKLNFNDMSKFKKEDIDWMKEQVLPTMARILDQPVHSQENPKGFGCLECHTQEGQ